MAPKLSSSRILGVLGCVALATVLGGCASLSSIFGGSSNKVTLTNVSSASLNVRFYMKNPTSEGRGTFLSDSKFQIDRGETATCKQAFENVTHGGKRHTQALNHRKRSSTSAMWSHLDEAQNNVPN